MGRGSTVHRGCAVGYGLAKLWPDRDQASLALTAGGGAGLAAAFNAPLAGLVFVLEELRWQCASLEFFATALACLSADMACRTILGQLPVFHLAPVEAPDLRLLATFVPLGMLCGALAVAFNQSLLRRPF
jgi:CIC family chloride channel protein